ncbi:hypothetical protein NMY22_g17265 [Coprinellus aureogranulatus]|nr:hypothetical protein NMY22_g17265 [Coprinellus aureogranulatus]
MDIQNFIRDNGDIIKGAIHEMNSEVSAETVKRINEVAVSSWAHNTRETQAAGLLRFSEHCDELKVPEERRMPASPTLLSSFLTRHAGVVSSKTIDGWMSALHAWHTINNAPWYGDSSFVSQVKKGASKLAPPPKPPRNPVTIDHMKSLHRGLNLSCSFDAAVWALACCAFWGCCRLGELTVELDSHIDGRFSVLRSFANVSYGESTQVGPFSGQSVVFRIPWTKMTREQGAILTIVGDNSCSPYYAMKHHLSLNKDAPADSHLFSYRDDDGDWCSMVKTRFMARCNGIWKAAGMMEVDGHSFRIGGSTELLLGGVPPHVVAMVGRWSSMTFLKYWRSVSQIIVNTFSSCYNTSRIPSISQAVDDFCARNTSS